MAGKSTVDTRRMRSCRIWIFLKYAPKRLFVSTWKAPRWSEDPAIVRSRRSEDPVITSMLRKRREFTRAEPRDLFRHPMSRIWNGWRRTTSCHGGNDALPDPADPDSHEWPEYLSDWECDEISRSTEFAEKSPDSTEASEVNTAPEPEMKEEKPKLAGWKR